MYLTALAQVRVSLRLSQSLAAPMHSHITFTKSVRAKIIAALDRKTVTGRLRHDHESVIC